MQLPLEITFRDMEPSPAIEQRIRQKASKLDRYFDRVMSCRVMVEAPHRHKHKGKLYHVRVDVTVPDGELVASRSPDEHHRHTDMNAVIRDAFDAIYKQLDGYVGRLRNDVKLHEPPPHGRVTELFDDHGTIDAADGRLIYFHRNSVVDDAFEHLKVGSEVWFAEEKGEEGPQASTVHVLDHHHIYEDPTHKHPNL
ncbi:HPF/RaiA family ribosome-associated protein [Thiohalomonas denitrificans]|uniref:Ribosomal subunit interface protein n=1 Tax=Thiohalomonas denitrificans TaxID=415747 RepID=A0A1G5QE54_9GAMM|nr:HPF/RaiA family ribosome-associated protein [Thiohalomonas denitrificans]SCZ59932.1 ribosomal subunit interface protein [Thiohalomonas denitrificans]